jgi:hypothetical protein
MIEHLAIGFLVGSIIGFVVCAQFWATGVRFAKREAYRRGVLDERARLSHVADIPIDYPEDLKKER